MPLNSSKENNQLDIVKTDALYHIKFEAIAI